MDDIFNLNRKRQFSKVKIFHSCFFCLCLFFPLLKANISAVLILLISRSPRSFECKSETNVESVDSFSKIE